MRSTFDPPVAPRDGQTLHILLIARISGENQDAKSLGDQGALIKAFVADRYDGPVNYQVVATRGSGEWLDRKETLQIQELVISRKYVLVVLEDLGRYMRDFEAIKFCGICIDYETRLLAMNDNLDTAKDGWQDNATFAAWRHNRHNDDTSRRIKRTLDNRFVQGRR